MADLSGAVNVFKHAVALEQSGKMKSIIACKGKVIYILNFDKTILMKFELSRGGFESEVCFNANDYDSDSFKEEGGKIIFTIKGEGNYDREKICKSPGIGFKRMEEMFDQFFGKGEETIAAISFTRNDLKLLDESLSHVEFISEGLKPVILQRDIFAGSVIKLEKKGFAGFKDEIDPDEIGEDYGPVGMRTNDLFALFAFNDIVSLFFLPPTYGYFIVEGKEYKMKAIVAKCLYDNLGQIEILGKEEIDHGGKISENGGTQQEADRSVGQGQESQKSIRRRRVAQE